ncbi:MAG TPA: MBL fold metallo-hydrolase [Steroidobacteraceae bacterium]|nr:MBL fold metallo-hydrolase [Steroidobacteraceae bacterium]
MNGTRRTFLGYGLVAAAAAPLAGLYPRTVQAATRLAVTPLAGRLSLITGGAANMVVASAGNELLLVDGGAEADAKALQKLLAEAFPGKRLRAVINTHWHLAQSGFNATARRAGVDVIAHENTKLWLGTEVNSRWEGKVYKPQPVAALPNRTFFYGPQALDFGGGKVEYVHLGQAHTDGDIYVRFPEENILVAGDVAAPGRYPIIDSASNGWLGGIHTALKTLTARCDSATKVVAATGAPVGVEALKQQQEMCYSIISRIGETYYKGGTYEEFLAAAPTREFDAQYGDPSLFLKQAYDTAWYHVGEIRRVAR